MLFRSAHEELRLAETALTSANSKLDQIHRAPLDSDAPLVVRSPQDGLLRQMHAVNGQTVAAGAPLFEVVSFDPVWIRVPVYSGDVNSLAPNAPARVGARVAQPVAAPPTADPLAVTSDLYFQLPNPGPALRPGERLSVTLQLRGREQSLQLPWSAVLHDIHGGTWVYEITAPNVFVRRRVEVSYVSGSTAVLARGPRPGVKVVAAGAAELYGTEFGAGK